MNSGVKTPQSLGFGRKCTETHSCSAATICCSVLGLRQNCVRGSGSRVRLWFFLTAGLALASHLCRLMFSTGCVSSDCLSTYVWKLLEAQRGQIYEMVLCLCLFVSLTLSNSTDFIFVYLYFFDISIKSEWKNSRGFFYLNVDTL